MDIKRFDMSHEHSIDINVIPVESSQGGFVAYEEHAAIVAQLQDQVKALTIEVKECHRFVAEELGPEAGIQFSGITTERADAVIREIGAKAVAPYLKALPELAGSFLNSAISTRGQASAAYGLCAHQLAELESKLRAAPAEEGV